MAARSESPAEGYTSMKEAKRAQMVKRSMSFRESLRQLSSSYAPQYDAIISDSHDKIMDMRREIACSPVPRSHSFISRPKPTTPEYDVAAAEDADSNKAEPTSQLQAVMPNKASKTPMPATMFKLQLPDAAKLIMNMDKLATPPAVGSQTTSHAQSNWVGTQHGASSIDDKILQSSCNDLYQPQADLNLDAVTAGGQAGAESHAPRKREATSASDSSSRNRTPSRSPSRLCCDGTPSRSPSTRVPAEAKACVFPQLVKKEAGLMNSRSAGLQQFADNSVTSPDTDSLVFDHEVVLPATRSKSFSYRARDMVDPFPAVARSAMDGPDQDDTNEWHQSTGDRVQVQLELLHSLQPASSATAPSLESHMSSYSASRSLTRNQSFSLCRTSSPIPPEQGIGAGQPSRASLEESPALARQSSCGLPPAVVRQASFRGVARQSYFRHASLTSVPDEKKAANLSRSNSVRWGGYVSGSGAGAESAPVSGSSKSCSRLQTDSSMRPALTRSASRLSYSSILSSIHDSSACQATEGADTLVQAADCTELGVYDLELDTGDIPVRPRGPWAGSSVQWLTEDERLRAQGPAPHRPRVSRSFSIPRCSSPVMRAMPADTSNMSAVVPDDSVSRGSVICLPN